MPESVPPYRPVANRSVRPWRWAVGILGALLFVVGTVLAFALFHGGSAVGLFGGSALAAFGLFAVIVAKGGEL